MELLSIEKSPEKSYSAFLTISHFEGVIPNSQADIPCPLPHEQNECPSLLAITLSLSVQHRFILHYLFIDY